MADKWSNIKNTSLSLLITSYDSSDEDEELAKALDNAQKQHEQELEKTSAIKSAQSQDISNSGNQESKLHFSISSVYLFFLL